jgi:hypothetical protein
VRSGEAARFRCGDGIALLGRDAAKDFEKADSLRRARGFAGRDCFPGMFALYRYLAQADVIKLCPYQSDGYDAEKCSEQQNSGTSSCGLGIRADEAGNCGGDDSDLSEPAEDRQLKDAGSAAGNHEEDAFRGCDRG